MLRISISAAALLALGAVGSCKERPSASAADAGSGSTLPQVRVLTAEDHYLLSWYDADGKIHDASHLADVPVDGRRQVLVRDLTRTPAELQADRYLYLADM